MASFQNSLLFLDYNINSNFYETHCINKDKPEMNCHGKCEMKKESEKTTSPFNLVKIGFEFNILPNASVKLPLPKKTIILEEKNSTHLSAEHLTSGFYTILPKPPRA